MDEQLEWARIPVYNLCSERYNRFVAIICSQKTIDGSWVLRYGSIETNRENIVKMLEDQYKNHDKIIVVDNPNGLSISGDNVHIFRSMVFDEENKKLLVDIWSLK